MTTTVEPLTFAELVEIEPRLANLAERARAVARTELRKGRRCCGTRGLIALEWQLDLLVGLGRPDKHPELGEGAYCVVRDHLYALMPDCRHRYSCL